ncbi:MAG: 30S ribosomal protein S6 [Spirochaetota bacterium]
MKLYEILFFSENNDAVFLRAKDKVKASLDAHGCVIEKEEDFGVKELAYDIGKVRDGHYYFYHFKAEPKVISGIESELKHDANILRSMIIALGK